MKQVLLIVTVSSSKDNALCTKHDGAPIPKAPSVHLQPLEMGQGIDYLQFEQAISKVRTDVS